MLNSSCSAVILPDFDECAANVDECVVEESTCVNTPGEVECDCLDGYMSTSTTTCEGI